MLTFLDGTIETRNRVIIANTNHIEKIDPALLREGRFDIKICLNYFTDFEIKELLQIMYGAENHDKIYSFTYQSGVYTPVKILNIAQQEDSLDDVIRILSGQAGDNSKYFIEDSPSKAVCSDPLSKTCEL
jgi:SpoVK/Ycf46/Vps4 family AAA+-type ATPase